MFQNLLKVAFRVIRKDLFYSLFNIVGLTIGITSSIFLLLYVSNELSYDRYHENSDNIYRVVSNITEPDDAFGWAVAQIPFAPQVKEDYPEVLEYVRYIDAGRTLFKTDETFFYEDDVYFVDSTVLDVFSWKLISGNPETALNEPNSIILTRSFSERYFGSDDPLGKSIETTGEDLYKVTGLMEDVPENSHLKFSALVSRNTLPRQMGSWGSFGVYTYLLLPEDTDYKQFESKISEMYDKYMAQIFEAMGIKVEYVLHPLPWIHLNSTYEGEPEPTGSKAYIYIFSVVALFMLVIASINYMNLATARSTRRAREVGLRKVMGSSRKLLISQFLTESMMLTLISVFLSVLLVKLLLPEFNLLSGKELDFSSLFETRMVLSLAGIVLLLGVAGGSYPAFYLSQYNPSKVLKGEVSSGYKKFSFRKILVVVQFSISLVMIISTWVVYSQISFLKNKDVGFDKTNVIRLNLSTRDMVNQADVFKEALVANPQILNVGTTNTIVGGGSSKSIFMVETPEGMDERGVNFGACDDTFIETLGITILEGRGFSREIMADTATGVIINQTLAKRMNWENPIGKKVQIGGSPDNENPVARVVGLMKDFNQTGLYNEVESYMLLFRLDNRVIYIKIDDSNIDSTIGFIEKKWKEVYPDIPLEYEYLEDDFNNQFEEDQKRGFILAVFAILTIIIAILGLYGLSSYTVEQRTKEIGIRKVLGANVSNITGMITKEFFILILFSMMIAFPIAYFLMKDWLQNYTYKTPLSIWIFVISGLAILFIALITVSFHTFRAGNANPVDSIRQN
ncbi:MAG: ABC transporter permease [Bacteroidales bacterium]|nr:ABC transporter permease [Bacteroidales bacterium]